MFRSQWDEDEQREPSPRRVSSSGNIIYRSHYFRPGDDFKGWGRVVISDLGEARIGLQHAGLIQPDIYRAPEVILGMKWGPGVDIWSIAMTVRLFKLLVVLYLARRG